MVFAQWTRFHSGKRTTTRNGISHSSSWDCGRAFGELIFLCRCSWAARFSAGIWISSRACLIFTSSKTILSIESSPRIEKSGDILSARLALLSLLRRSFVQIWYSFSLSSLKQGEEAVLETRLFHIQLEGVLPCSLCPISRKALTSLSSWFSNGLYKFFVSLVGLIAANND